MKHDCLCTGDTGDAKPGAENTIYRIMEPTSITVDQDISVTSADILMFR